MDLKKPPMPVNIGARPHLAVDRFGNLIEPGHLVMYHANLDAVYEVVDVRPVLNPALVAQGQQAMQVTLRAQFPVQVAAAQPSASLVIVGLSEAKMKAMQDAAKNGQPAEPEPPAADPTPETTGPRLVLTDVDPTATKN